jgi:flavin-binding protein dodecin
MRMPRIQQLSSTGERTMSIARTTEISSSSKVGFKDAIENGIARFADTIDKVEGAWVKEQKVKIKEGKVTEYRVVLKVSFVLKD